MTMLAIFDCDGTLVDSQASICLAMESTFIEAGLPPPNRNDIRQVVGLSLVEIMRRLLPEQHENAHRDMAERYRASFLTLRGQGQVDEPLYEGMKELIIAMKERDWMLGVATGKSDRGLLRCLNHHGLREHFITLQTADRHPSKPHPSMIQQAMADAAADPGGTIMIGDTSYDIDMGRAAGCRTVGVAWGYHTGAELAACGADFVADTVAELVTHLEAIQ